MGTKYVITQPNGVSLSNASLELVLKVLYAETIEEARANAESFKYTLEEEIQNETRI